MRAELQIVWDGTAPGLAEHELSVAAHAKSLDLLLKALRRIATTTIQDARRNAAPGAPQADTERGAKGGRLARGVDQIDLRVRGLGHGCLRLDLKVLFPEEIDEPQQALFDPGIADATLASLLRALGAESRGEPSNVAVRKYLQSLPGVTTQRYIAWRGGQKNLGGLARKRRPPPTPSEHPYLAVLRGVVSGVRFDEPQVLIRSAERRVVSLTATAPQVERALALRDQDIVARYTTAERNGARARLVALQPADAHPPARPSAEEAGRHVLARWETTLERLAR